MGSGGQLRANEIHEGADIGQRRGLGGGEADRELLLGAHNELQMTKRVPTLDVLRGQITLENEVVVPEDLAKNGLEFGLYLY